MLIESILLSVRSKNFKIRYYSLMSKKRGNIKTKKRFKDRTEIIGSNRCRKRTRRTRFKSRMP